MKNICRICLHDVRTLLVVPTGAIIAALFTFTCGIVFVAQILEPNGIATMQPMFSFGAWILLLLCPAITMRLVAEERRVGTWEGLLASPVTSFELCKGKFLSALLFLVLVLLSTVPLILILEIYASVDYGAVASGYLGLLLLGSAVIATGLVVSALTTSQTVAYVVTAFVWLTFSLSMKVIPSYVPTRFADFFFAMDPDFRTAAFSIGLIDTANIVYFLTISIALGWIACVAIQRTRHVRSSFWKVFVCGLLLICSIFSINYMSVQPVLRARIDATGSRAYSLSDQTTQLIENLEGNWGVTVLLDDSRVEKPIVQQVDEVLRRYQEQSESIQVQRINPTDPFAMEQYEALLHQLIQLYEEELVEAKSAIAEGIDQFSALMTFASSTSVWAEDLSAMQSTQEEQETLQTISSVLALLGTEGNLVLDEVQKAMQIDVSQPLPRVSFARDILVAATGQWSRELAEVSWWLTQGRSNSIKQFCLETAPLFDGMATDLAVIDDRLRRLGELEVGSLASQLALGEGAIIISPKRATMIPAAMLFPKSVGGSNTIAVDQRFRGEQIISSAIRSLQSRVLPTVVFVHAEENSLLNQQPNNIDIRAVRGLLETSRFEVREWMPVEESKPSIESGPVVWVVIPPSNRAGLEPSQSELTLLNAVQGLFQDGESVLLNIQPSLLPRYGQQDPWVKIVEPLGISIDTENVLVERVAVGPNSIEVHRGQLIHETNSEHLIARAVNGRQAYFPLPLAISGGEQLLCVHPSEDRWFDQNWEREITDMNNYDPITETVTIASAIEYLPNARAVVVGSGGWLFTWAADRAVSLGGNQIAMVNPGNSELLLASVEWLAGLDDWIATGPIGQQSSRVQGLSQTMYLVWTGIVVLGIPCVLLGFAVGTYIVRHR